MTEQEVFDTVAKHLLAQGARSKSGGECAYRGDGGLKCAVGCLIADSDYVKDMEGLIVHDLLEHYSAPSLEPIRQHKPLLLRLQHLHDVGKPGEWVVTLRWLAEEYNLSPAVLEDA